MNSLLPSRTLVMTPFMDTTGKLSLKDSLSLDAAPSSVTNPAIPLNKSDSSPISLNPICHITSTRDSLPLSSKSLLLHIPKDSVISCEGQSEYSSSGPSSINSSTADPSLKKTRDVRFKKHRLLRRCHRQLKRLLRTPGFTSTGLEKRSDELVNHSDVTETCQKCHVNAAVLNDLQTKYSDLCAEVSSLRRRLYAVQHAFTSLRTMLLASFPNDRLGGSDGLTSGTVRSDPDNLVAAVSSCAGIIDAFRCGSSLHAPHSELTKPPADISKSESSVITKVETQRQFSPPSVAPQTTQVSPTSPLAPLPIQLTDSVSHSTTVSSASSPSQLVWSKGSAVPNLTVPSTSVVSPLTDPDCSKLYSVSTLPFHQDLPYTDTLVESSSVDTYQLTEFIRSRMITFNISQRRLGRQLNGMSQKTISDLLRKPKPWSQVTLRSRLAYLKMYQCLVSMCSSELDFLKGKSQALSDTHSPFAASGSLQSAGTSPWTISGTDDAALGEMIPDHLCVQTDLAQASPFEPSASPGSFSSVHTTDSNYATERNTSKFFRSSYRTPTGPFVADSAIDSMEQNSDRVSVSSTETSGRKYPSDLDVETRKRISNILSAARIAMAQEKSDGTSQANESSQSHVGKRRKRSSDADTVGFHVKQEVLLNGDLNGCPYISAVSDVSSGMSVAPNICSTGLNVSNFHQTSTLGTLQPSQSTLSPLVSPSVVMSTGVIGPNPNSAIGVPVQNVIGSIPLAAVPGSISVGLPQNNLVVAQQPIPELLQLLATQSGNGTKTLNIVNNRGERLSIPIAAVKIGSTNGTSFCPSQSNSGAQLANLCAVTKTVSMPGASSDLTDSVAGTRPVLLPGVTGYSGLPPSSSSSIPSQVIQVPNIVQPIGMSPLQQTLMLLAAAAAQASGQQSNCTADLPKLEPVVNPVLSSSSSLRVAAVRSLSEMAPAENPGESDLMVVHSPSASAGCNQLDEEGIPLAQSMDDSIARLLSTINWQQLPLNQMKQLSDCLSPLDVYDITNKVKNHLRELNVSQRLLGELVLNMSQATVSDIINKPRQWEFLNPKSRLVHFRLHLWLQQPNGTEALLLAQAIQRARPRLTLDLNPLTVTDSTNSDDPPQSVVTCDLEGLNCRKRDASALPSTSPCNTPTKLPKQEATGCDSSSDPDKPLAPLAEYERQSLFDIAKAATVAMQRASNSGFFKHLKPKSTSDSPNKCCSNSRSTTPVKSVSTDAPSSPMDIDAGTPALGSPIKMSPVRCRVVFTTTQKEALMAAYNRQPYPHSDTLREIAKELDLSYKTVLNWFHNRRMRSRQPPSLTFIDHLTSRWNDRLPGTVNSLFTGSSVPNCERIFESVLSKPSSTQTISNSEISPESEHATCPVAQLSHQNRRKRPDPARLITPCL